MLYAFLQYSGEEVGSYASLNGYQDASQISGQAYDAMGWAVTAGILGGYEDDTSRPQNTATRAEAAVMLMRFCEQFAE